MSVKNFREIKLNQFISMDGMDSFQISATQINRVLGYKKLKYVSNKITMPFIEDAAGSHKIEKIASTLPVMEADGLLIKGPEKCLNFVLNELSGPSLIPDDLNQRNLNHVIYHWATDYLFLFAYFSIAKIDSNHEEFKRELIKKFRHITIKNLDFEGSRKDLINMFTRTALQNYDGIRFRNALETELKVLDGFIKDTKKSIIVDDGLTSADIAVFSVIQFLLSNTT